MARPLPIAVRDELEGEGAPGPDDAALAGARANEALALVVAAQGARTFEAFLERAIANGSRDMGLALARIDALLDRAFPLAMASADGEARGWIGSVLALQRARRELIEGFGAVASENGAEVEEVERARLVLERTRTRKVTPKKIESAPALANEGEKNAASEPTVEPVRAPEEAPAPAADLAPRDPAPTLETTSGIDTERERDERNGDPS